MHTCAGERSREGKVEKSPSPLPHVHKRAHAGEEGRRASTRERRVRRSISLDKLCFHRVRDVGKRRTRKREKGRKKVRKGRRGIVYTSEK